MKLNIFVIDLPNLKPMIQTRKFFEAMLCLLFCVSIAACKEDDPQPAFEYQTQGFIKGKFTGKSGDNAYTFNEDFNFTQYSVLFGGLSTYEINDDASYTLLISRANFPSYGAISVRFDLENATDTTPENLDIQFEYTKELSTNFLTFAMGSDADNISTITNVNFDAKSGRCTGKFSLAGLKNSAHQNATVIGEFDVIAKRPIQ